MKTAHFDTIAIIQSLPAGELKTGTKLIEDLEVLNIAYDRKLDLRIYDVHTDKDFFKVLTNLKEETKSNKNLPAIHIECHGSSDQSGLVMASGDFVSWVDLKPFLTEINIETKNNLLVFLAACNGAHLTSAVLPTDRALCWGLVGPTKTVTSENLLKCFYEFYRVLLNSGSGSKAVKTLNTTAGNENITYSFTNSEIFFELVYRNYMKEKCTAEALKERAKGMRKKMKKDKALKTPSVGNIKRMLKGTQKNYFEKYKNQFFMIDLYPENLERFTVDYDKVINF